MPLFGQKCQFWAKFGLFLAKKAIFWAVGVKLLVPSYNHLGVPNNIQPSLGNIEPVLGVHATKRQKIPYLGTMPFCEFKMAKMAFLSSCLIFATVHSPIIIAQQKTKENDEKAGDSRGLAKYIKNWHKFDLSRGKKWVQS